MKSNLTILLLAVFLAAAWLFFQGGVLIQGLIFVLTLLVGLWGISLSIKDSSIIDIFWGPGFVLMGWFYYHQMLDEWNLRLFVFCMLVTIWGIRLGGYLGIRNWGKGEDPRYQAFRKEGGNNYWWISLFKVFVFQGIILWVLASIFYAAMFYNPGRSTLNWLDYIGLIIWVAGFLWEAIGDYQLMRFKRNPQNQGKVLDQGLWKYSRHPNYFGDALLWWGYYCFALSVGAWMYIFSPLIMSFLLMRISGVSMLERNLKKAKTNYSEYMEKTPAFFPRIPKEQK